MRTVVVGASSGLGRCIAIGLAQRGAHVAMLARRRERLEAAAREAGPGSLAIECDGDKAQAMDQLREDMARQAILERLGWSFVRVRASEFFLDPEKAMKPVFARLGELKIRAEGGGAGAEAPPNGKDVLERIVRRAAEYRQHWVSQAKAQLARAGNGVAERARRPVKAVKKKRKAAARK